MRQRLPVRWRLTIWYTVLWLVSTALLGVALYLGIRDELYDGFEEQFRRQAALTRQAVRIEPDSLSLSNGADPDQQDEEYFVRLMGPDRRVLDDTSSPVIPVPVDYEAVTAALAGQTRRSTHETAGRTFLVETSPVTSGGQVVGVVQVGSSREDVDEVLELLRLGLGVAEPIMVILGGIVGYWLAGRALAPVASITALAGRIQADDLSARLALDLPDDELGRLSRTFDAMLDRIEDAFERQRRFTGDAAHELRTPLSFLRSQVDFALARPRTPAEYEEALQGIDSDLDRVTRLVRSLLTLSRADTGNLPLHYEPVDLPGTIALLLEQYEPRATEAGIRLINASRPTPLTGDADRLIQVLVNLLDNALAHTPSGGEIEVGSGPAGDQARLWVRDTGAGIPPEHQERVFDRFYRVDTGRARERGGVGLGLSICKMIAEAHGGTIAISTPNGGGTRVELLLPVKP